MYINGQKVYEKEGWVHEYIYIPLAEGILKKGENLLAIECKNTAGGRFLDAGIVEEVPQAANMLNANQTNVSVGATHTLYTFKAGGINLNLTFTSPLLLNDLNLTARPISYLTYC